MRLNPSELDNIRFVVLYLCMMGPYNNSYFLFINVTVGCSGPDS